MNKFVLFLVLSCAMIVAPIVLFAADGGEGNADLAQIGFATFAILVASIPVAVEAVKGVFKPVNKTVIQIISWCTGIALTMLAWWLNLGFLEPLIWWQALIVGLFASLAANGVWDVGIYEQILKALGILKK